MSEYIYETQGEQVIGWPKGFILPKEEIVRCRDCKHCYVCGSFMFCEFRRPDAPVNADGFCAWAARRVDA